MVISNDVLNSVKIPYLSYKDKKKLSCKIWINYIKTIVLGKISLALSRLVQFVWVLNDPRLCFELSMCLPRTDLEKTNNQTINLL